MSEFPYPLIKRYGSKFTLAKRGVYPTPRHRAISEPFAGGAGYSLCHAEHRVSLFDLDKRLIDTWSWLLRSSPADILSLPVDLQPGTELCGKLGFAPEATSLIGYWQRVGNNECTTVSKWNGKPGMWGAATRSRIANGLERVRHWNVECCDWPKAFSIIEQQENACTVFVDPPYQHNRGGYKHDAIDYSRLGHECTRLRSLGHQLIVCEQSGANWLPFRPLVEVNAGIAHHAGKIYTEVIWP